jgi:chaperone protein clpB
MIEANLSYFLEKASEFAFENYNEYLTSEHILLTLLHLDKNSLEILISSGFDKDDKDELEYDLKKFIDDNNEQLKQKQTPKITLNVEQIFKDLQSQKSNITTKDFLYKLATSESFCADLLQAYGVDRDKILNSDEMGKFENLIKFSTNLNELAIKGKLDTVIGREDELERTIQTLSRRKKNNPILVGEAGVGKTAIANALAIKIVSGDVPSRLKDVQILALDIAAMVAGTKYRGDFEKRLKEIIDEVKEYKNAILFIDEIHTIVGTGATNGSSLDMSNILKPALADGSLRVIGATTYTEYRQFFEKEKALSRRFAKIDIDEPSIDDSILILKGIKGRYEEFHNVKIGDDIIEKSVELAKKFMSEKFLPDSAIDLIDEMGASLNIKGKKNALITDLTETLSKIAKIPDSNLKIDNSILLKNLERNLKQEIFGQDEAVQNLVAAIKRSYAGLKNTNSPIGVFLFTGSSGIGKSELAKSLSKNLNINFECFDMSEYMEKHSVARLIGAPPGYIGFEGGGLLTNAVKKHPYSVILFDEIEKANDEMINIFLQIFDNASLTDNTGAKSDFKNTIIIMTSNLGSKESPKMGFTKNENDRSDTAIKSFFTPEFRNRIDKIINFNPLNKKVLGLIVDKILHQINNNLKDKKVTIIANKNAIELLYKKGYSDEFGARNLQRIINELISDKISDELLFGKLKNGGSINISVKNNELKFDFLNINSESKSKKLQQKI